MTTPERRASSAASFSPEVTPISALGRTGRPRAGSLAHRFGHWVADKGWIHVLLLTGVAICVYPFVWMLLMSIKTDEELAENKAQSSLPSFRESSPYVRERANIERPEDVSAAQWSSLEGPLWELTLSVVGPSLPSQMPPSVDRVVWASSAASVLMSRNLPRMPRQIWTEDWPAMAEHYRQFLTPELVDTAISDQLARVELSALTLHALDGRQFKLVGGADFGARLHVEHGAGSLEPLGDVTWLRYAFQSSSDPVVLVHDFALPPGVSASDIHKLVLALRADASWNRIEATLDVGGIHWESAHTTYLAQNRALSISFQPPSFDDTTLRARTWVPLAARGSSDRGDQARARIILSPSSTLRAIWGKVLANYVRAFRAVPFFRYVGNSLLLAALTMLGAMFSSAFVAYAFARLRWPGRGIALAVLLSTMMIPSQVTMIPSFLLYRGLGWYNTLNPLWVPAWLGSAFFIFLMVQQMKTLPRELEEAARIDGLGVVQTWWYVIVPQVKSTLAAISIMSFLGAWNEFLGPLIYLRDQAKFPLSLGLFGMRVDQGSVQSIDWPMIMAANVLLTAPSVVVFFVFQRYFIEGMTVSGMKG
ncbi:MAG TPA: ABC transporter permease subunit [Polyangiaceae bacterium]|nr:ABC transporter permease subunit [Polyangiaceae bacterium]